MTDDTTYWWGQPLRARRYHIFEGESPIAGSLCGDWQMGYGDDLPEQNDSDTFTDGQDCKACCREAGLLEGDR